METILAASIPALITGVITIVTVLITNAKSRKDILKVTLRNTIQSAYYAYMSGKDIPMTVYSGVCEMYDEYKSLGGNSYISQLMNEMNSWHKY